MEKLEAQEKAKLLKKSLVIVDKLGKLDIDESNEDVIYKLIKEAKEMRKSQYWNLW